MNNKPIDTALLEAFIDTAKILRGKGVELCPENVALLKTIALDESVEWLMEQAYSYQLEELKVDTHRRKKIRERFLDLVREENPNHPFLEGKGFITKE